MVKSNFSDTTPFDDMEFEIDMASVFEEDTAENLNPHDLSNLHNLCAKYLATNEETILNEIEEQSLHTLIAYTAQEQGVAENMIHALIQNRFSVSHYTQLPRRYYEAVVRYLVSDLNLNETVN